MTLEEARIVAEICSQCDGNCGPCVNYLSELLNEKFPGFAWTFVDGCDAKIVVEAKGADSNVAKVRISYICVGCFAEISSPGATCVMCGHTEPQRDRDGSLTVESIGVRPERPFYMLGRYPHCKTCRRQLAPSASTGVYTCDGCDVRISDMDILTARQGFR